MPSGTSFIHIGKVTSRRHFKNIYDIDPVAIDSWTCENLVLGFLHELPEGSEDAKVSNIA